MAELGWLGLIIAPEHGGVGLSWVDQIVILEEMGRSLFPSPTFRIAWRPRHFMNWAWKIRRRPYTNIRVPEVRTEFFEDVRGGVCW